MDYLMFSNFNFHLRNSFELNQPFHPWKLKHENNKILQPRYIKVKFIHRYNNRIDNLYLQQNIYVLLAETW